MCNVFLPKQREGISYRERFRDPMLDRTELNSTRKPNYKLPQVFECPSAELYSYFEESGNYENFQPFKGGASAEEPCTHSVMMTQDPSYVNEMSRSQPSYSAYLNETDVSGAFRSYYDRMNANQDVELVDEADFRPALHSSNPQDFWGEDQVDMSSLHYSLLDRSESTGRSRHENENEVSELNNMERAAFYECRNQTDNNREYLYDGDNRVKIEPLKQRALIATMGRKKFNRIMWKINDRLRRCRC